MMESHITTEVTYMEHLAKLRLERIRELDREIAECEEANRHLGEEIDAFDPEDKLIPVVFARHVNHLESKGIDLDNRIADLKRRRDALLAQPLGDTPKNDEPRSIDSQSNW